MNREYVQVVVVTASVIWATILFIVVAATLRDVADTPSKCDEEIIVLDIVFPARPLACLLNTRLERVLK